jgi:hypothetical protein
MKPNRFFDLDVREPSSRLGNVLCPTWRSTKTPSATERFKLESYTPCQQRLGLAGHWMMISTLEETVEIGGESSGIQPLTSREISRQLVTITEREDTTIEFAGEKALAVTRNNNGLQYDVELPVAIKSLAIPTVTSLPVRLIHNGINILRGTTDSGFIDLQGELFTLRYRFRQDFELIRVCADTHADIGSLLIDWLFVDHLGVTTSEQRRETVNGFSEIFRETNDGESWWGILGDSRGAAPTHSLTVGTQTLKITFEDQYYVRTARLDPAGNATALSRPVPSVSQFTRLQVKATLGNGGLGLGQCHDKLTAAEIDSIAPPSSIFVRQPFMIDVNSARGVVNIERDGQFVRSQLDLYW